MLSSILGIIGGFFKGIGVWLSLLLIFCLLAGVLTGDVICLIIFAVVAFLFLLFLINYVFYWDYYLIKRNDKIYDAWQNVPMEVKCKWFDTYVPIKNSLGDTYLENGKRAFVELCAKDYNYFDHFKSKITKVPELPYQYFNPLKRNVPLTKEQENALSNKLFYYTNNGVELTGHAKSLLFREECDWEKKGEEMREVLTRKRIALKLKEKGVDYETIAIATGLSLQDVHELNNIEEDRNDVDDNYVPDYLEVPECNVIELSYKELSPLAKDLVEKARKAGYNKGLQGRDYKTEELIARKLVKRKVDKAIISEVTGYSVNYIDRIESYHY